MSIRLASVALVASLIPALSVWGAKGFDSAAWLEKREVFSREAERLRAAYSNCTMQVQEAAEGVMLPVETYPNGAVKTSLAAKRVQFFLDKGLVWAEGVCLKRFSADGKLDLQVDAAACLVDRSTKSGWAEGAVKMTYGATTVSGEGTYFSSPENYISIWQKTSLTSSEVSGKGLRGGSLKTQASSASIASVRGDFDRGSRVALFEQGVRVDYDEVTLCSERLFAFFDVSNRLSRAVAIGSVVVTNGVRTGACAKAMFRRLQRDVCLYGDGQGQLARLSEGGEGGNVLAGESIRFWIDDEQVEVRQAQLDVKTTKSKGGVLP